MRRLGAKAFNARAQNPGAQAGISKARPGEFHVVERWPPLPVQRGCRFGVHYTFLQP